MAPLEILPEKASATVRGSGAEDHRSPDLIPSERSERGTFLAGSLDYYVGPGTVTGG